MLTQRMVLTGGRTADTIVVGGESRKLFKLAKPDVVVTYCNIYHNYKSEVTRSIYATVHK